MNFYLKLKIRTYSTSNLPIPYPLGEEKEDNNENLVPLIAYDNFKSNIINNLKEQKDK